MTTIKKKMIVATAAAITLLGTFIETQQVADAQAATSTTFKAASSATKALRYKATKAATIRKSANTTSAKVASLPKSAFVKVTGTQASYTKDLHVFAFNAENITDSVVTDLQKNNLSM